MAAYPVLQVEGIECPVADVRPVALERFGLRWVDEYAWLRADNWQDVLRDPAALPADIRDYLDRENNYAKRVMAATQDLQEELFLEIKGRIQEDDAGAPVPDGPYAYRWKYRVGGQHKLVCRAPRGGGDDVVVLDGDKLAEGRDFYMLGDWAYSRNHVYMAWGDDVAGSEFHTIHVIDMETGLPLADTVPMTEGPMVWRADSKAFFYVRMDDNHRPIGVFEHVLGTEVANDRLVFEEPDIRMFTKISELNSGRFMAIEVYDHDRSEVWLLDITVADAKPVCVMRRQDGVLYDVVHHPDFGGRDTLVIRTNVGALDFKVVAMPVADLGHTVAWESLADIVPSVDGRMISQVGVLKNWLILETLEDANRRVVVRNLTDGKEQVLSGADPVGDLHWLPLVEFGSDCVRVSFSSFVRPPEVHDVDLVSGERVLRKKVLVPSGLNTDDYVVWRMDVVARDGVRVPVSLVRRKDVAEQGDAPGLLYGYGSYGAVGLPAFSPRVLSLLDRGFVYAIAHIRGGGEKGRGWYLDGKLANKEHTFRDFIDVAEALAAQRVMGRGRIVARGGSAGGLLMGAVANMAPEGLFAGILASVPFVDVVNTMSDESLPLTPPEWVEWGNPLRDKDALVRMMGYSPYDNVVEKRYPPLLIHAGVTDPRVTYWEPAKWVARLRARKVDQNPLLMVMNMTSGHFGAGGRFDILRELAREWAFALCVVQKA